MASRDYNAEAEEAKTQGNAALKAEDFDLAIKWYTQALEFSKKANPPGLNKHIYLSNRSAAYTSKGYYDSALKDAVACVEAAPEWPKGYVRKGAALHGLKQFDEGIKAYELGLSKFPEDAPLQRGLEEIRAAQQEVRSGRAPMARSEDGDMDLSSIFRSPEAMEKLRGDPETAEYLKDPSFMRTLDLLATNPDALSQLLGSDPRVLKALSVAMGMNIRMPDAGEAAPAAKKETKEEIAARKRAEEEAAKKAAEEAEAARRAAETPEERAQREAAERAEARKAAGNALYKKREFEGALREYEAAIQENPTQMAYHLNIASVHLERGDLEACLGACDRALEVGRANHAGFDQIAKVYERRGNMYFKVQRYEEALTEYRRAQVESRSDAVEERIRKTQQLIKTNAERAYLNPEEGKLAKERGNEFFKKADFPSAVREYSDAIKRDPTNAVYHVNRAAAYTKLTEFGRALEDAEKAVSLDPKYVKAYARLGKIYVVTKKLHRALDAYQKGLAIDPNDVECQEGMVQVEREINKVAHQTSDEDSKLRAARAMEDPEIRAILQDPIMAQVLRDLGSDPKAARKHLADPGIAGKIQKLIAAGVVKTG